MIKTIFEEQYEAGKVEGKAEGEKGKIRKRGVCRKRVEARNEDLHKTGRLIVDDSTIESLFSLQ